MHSMLSMLTLSSGGSKGGTGDACPPGGPNSFNFMQFLGKFGKIVCWCPPGELVPPPQGNPGSATAVYTVFTPHSTLYKVLCKSHIHQCR